VKRLSFIAILALGFHVAWWSWRTGPLKPVAPTIIANPSPSASSIKPRANSSPLAAQLNAPDGNAQQDVETLLELTRQYLHPMHRRAGPPIGDDIDLARVLTGRNPLKLVVIPPGHSALSADGHLRDRWGTPYFIHARASDAFEIRSAGPDKKLFTSDDAVANPAPANR
jgi:hypothetical protein